MLVYTLIILLHCYVASITSGICRNIILTDGWARPARLAPIVWTGLLEYPPTPLGLVQPSAYSRYATLARDLICSTYLVLGPAYNQSLSPHSPQPTAQTQPHLIIWSPSHFLLSLTSHLSPLTSPLLQTQIIRAEEEKEKVEAELMRQARDLEMLQNTIQKSQRERENMQTEMEVLLDRINKMSDMLDKARVGCL